MSQDQDGPGSGSDRLPVPTLARSADVATVVARTIAVGFGAAALLADVLLRAAASGAAGAVQGPRVDGRRPAPFQASAGDVVDAALGAGWGVARFGGRAVELGMRVSGPVLSVALDPPLVPRSVRPSRLIERAGSTWRQQRPGSAEALVGWSTSAVSDAVGVALTAVDVDQILWAVVDQLDLDATIARMIERIDIDAAAVEVVGAIDVDAVAAILVERLDLDAVIAEVLAGIDLAAIVDQTLARVDLTTIVMERVDLGDVVNKALDDLDLTQLVLQRVDLVRIADYVIDAIDLPEIVRESTGSIASETVREIRLQSVDADRAVSRVVDRMLLRRRLRKTQAVEMPDDDVAAPAADDPTTPPAQSSPAEPGGPS